MLYGVLQKDVVDCHPEQVFNRLLASYDVSTLLTSCLLQEGALRFHERLLEAEAAVLRVTVRANPPGAAAKRLTFSFVHFSSSISALCGAFVWARLVFTSPTGGCRPGHAVVAAVCARGRRGHARRRRRCGTAHLSAAPHRTAAARTDGCPRPADALAATNADAECRCHRARRGVHSASGIGIRHTAFSVCRLCIHEMPMDPFMESALASAFLECIHRARRGGANLTAARVATC